jgi:hypothetical protein
MEDLHIVKVGTTGQLLMEAKDAIECFWMRFLAVIVKRSQPFNNNTHFNQVKEERNAKLSCYFTIRTFQFVILKDDDAVYST